MSRVDRRFEIDDSSEYRCVGVRWYGLGAFVREKLFGYEIRRKQQWIIRQEDIVYNKLFAWKGAFAVAGNEVDGCIVSDKFPTYSADTEMVDARYLGYYFRTELVGRQALVLSKGAAAISKLTLNPPQFWDLTIPLPDLSEQRKTVAKIEQLEAKIEEARSLRRSFEENADSILLSQINELVYNRVRSFPIEPLADLVDPKRGISYGIVQTGDPCEDGIPTLRAGDLHRFVVNTSAVKRVHPEIETRYVRTRLQGTELLLRIRGGVGEVAVCPGEMAGGNVSREIAVIPLTGRVLPQFMMYAIAAPSSQDFIRRQVRGSSYVGINLYDVRKLLIPVPSLEEQRHIVGHLDGFREKIERIRKLQAQTSAELYALLPSILDKAFRGEL